MKKSERIKHCVKHVLIVMSAEGSLPSDMTQLNIDFVFDIAKAAIKSDKYILTESDEEATEHVMAILKGANTYPNGMIDHIDCITTVERYEYVFTIKDFLTELNLIQYT